MKKTSHNLIQFWAGSSQATIPFLR